MWLMLQCDEPDDFVIATGETHTVRELCDRAFARTGVELAWEGSGVDERGVDKATGSVRVEIDPRYFRPTEVELLLVDASKAKEKLGWSPSTAFGELVDLMVDADLDLAATEARLGAK
jgi:GDPmannose 4,6-dehydratase